MLRKNLLLAIVAVGIAGCASAPVIKDTTPLNPTAVIETHVSSNGIKGAFPFETDDTVYLRADRKRNASMFKGTGTFTGFLLGSHSGIRITRLDHGVIWKLDPDKKEYTECPLTGCVPSGQPPAEQASGGRGQQPHAQQQSGCAMRVSRSVFKVTPTGKTRNINGFATHEYQVSWVATLRDHKRRTSTSRLNLDMWTTTPDKAMRDAMKVEAEYKRARARATHMRHGHYNHELLPDDANKLIMAYLANSLNRHDLKAFMRAGRQMRKIKGHPILTKVTWDISGNACNEDEQQQENSPAPSTPSGVLSGLSHMITGNKDESGSNKSGGEPLLSLTVEVKQYQVAPEHDSLFQLPANYQKVAAQ